MTDKKCKINMEKRQLDCNDGETIGFDDLKNSECQVDRATKRVKCKDGREIQLE